MSIAEPSTSKSRIESSPLYNPDLAPATADRRHWGTYNFAALWISMSVNILTYMLAASLIHRNPESNPVLSTIPTSRLPPLTAGIGVRTTSPRFGFRCR